MQSTTNKYVLLLLLTAAGILLAIGLIAPIITFKKFIFIQNTFSILTACWNLFKQGQFFLFAVIALFSIILPIFKLAFLFKPKYNNQFIENQVLIIKSEGNISAISEKCE